MPYENLKLNLDGINYHGNPNQPYSIDMDGKDQTYAQV